jgi:hypothetical protein
VATAASVDISATVGAMGALRLLSTIAPLVCLWGKGRDCHPASAMQWPVGVTMRVLDRRTCAVHALLIKPTTGAALSFCTHPRKSTITGTRAGWGRHLQQPQSVLHVTLPGCVHDHMEFESARSQLLSGPRHAVVWCGPPDSSVIAVGKANVRVGGHCTRPHLKGRNTSHNLVLAPASVCSTSSRSFDMSLLKIRRCDVTIECRLHHAFV